MCVMYERLSCMDSAVYYTHVHYYVCINNNDYPSSGTMHTTLEYLNNNNIIYYSIHTTSRRNKDYVASILYSRVVV